jgi:hypothetical protein
MAKDHPDKLDEKEALVRFEAALRGGVSTPNGKPKVKKVKKSQEEGMTD